MRKEETRDSSSLSFLVDFAAGGIAGALAKTATAPIERVKLIMQTQDANPLVKSGVVPRYSSIVNCFSRVYTEQGVRSFWRGNFTNVIRYFPTQAFNFSFKDRIKSLFPKYSPYTEFLMYFVTNVASGSLAGAGSLCIVYPLDYARTRLAVDVGASQKSFTGLTDCVKKTAKGPSGILGLYNGFGISIIGIIPYRGVYFGLYDSISGINPFRQDHGPIGLMTKFIIAQSTAITSGYCSYPFDTIRRRLQMQSEKPSGEWIYNGAIDCFWKILSSEGVGGLFKGAAANVFRTVGSALVLVLYDEIKRFLGFEGGVGVSDR